MSLNFSKLQKIKAKAEKKEGGKKELLEVRFQPSNSVMADVCSISILIFLSFYLLRLKSCFLPVPHKKENEQGPGTAKACGINIYFFLLYVVSSPLKNEERFGRKIKCFTTCETAITTWTWLWILNSAGSQPENLKGIILQQQQ